MLFVKTKPSRPVSQTTKIYLALKGAGKYGMWNYDLAKVCLGWHRRIGNLRAEGNNIQSVHIKGSGWKYYLNLEDE